MSAGLRAPALALACALGACEPAACEEDVRAQQIDERISLQLGDDVVEAELADEPVERERGWMHRRCGREGLLLVPDAPGALPVWGCNLTAAIDLHLVHDGEVIEVIRGLSPCSPPCDGCRVVGEGVVVHAVLETPAGALAADPGAAVSGLPP